MKKRLAVWVTLIILLLVSLPGIISRWSAEVSNTSVELVVPYKEIYDISLKNPISIDEVLSLLKDVGLSTVSISPLSLSDLEERNIVSIFNEIELSKALYFAENHDDLRLEKGYYISIPSDSYYQELIHQSVKPETVTIAGEDLYFVPNEDKITRSTIVGYDSYAIEKIKSQQLQVLFRAQNSSDSDYIASTLLNLAQPHSRLSFEGTEVLGYPDPNQIKNWSRKLNNAGFTFYSIEFADQKGFQTLARTTGYNIVRLHSIDLDQKDLSESINQAVRAIKERNIRSILFHFPSEEDELNLDSGISFIEGVNQKLPSQFIDGIPVPFKDISIPSWITYILLIAGILFTYLFSTNLKSMWMTTIAVGGMLLFALAYALFDRLVFLQVFALGIAIIAPTFSVIISNAKQGITKQFFRAIGVNFIGIMIVVGLLNGNAFIAGFEVFRGVKLVYLLPILITGIFLFFGRHSRISINKNVVTRLLNSEVKYWHLILLLLAGVAGLYYMIRSGNTGVAPEFELFIRNKLEEYLYVRPRTKEFLVGFPLYILGLFIMRKHEFIGKLILVISVIGFLSMMNTFTHLHIPIYISLLRTVYSVLLGYVIGMFLIYLYKTLIPITEKLQKRWI